MSFMSRCIFKDCKKRSSLICIDCYGSFCDKHIEHDHYSCEVGKPTNTIEGCDKN